jgi:uncharacterized sulfatase
MTRDPGIDKGGRHGDDGLRIGRETLEPIFEFIDSATREAKPFFVWYAPLLPHDPHTPPERFLARYRDRAPSLAVAKYWAMIEWFDETCGQLLDFLERRRLAENTLVVYIADNGWITDPATGRYAPKSKQSPYDGGLRTPILLRWPGHLKPERSATLVSAVDLAPTILKAAGIIAPADLPGVDLTAAAALRKRKEVVGACFTHDAIDLDRPERNVRWRWCVRGDWKLILPDPVNEAGAAPELYNVTVDPLETRDLARSKPARVKRLQRLVDRWWPGREPEP